MIETKLTPRIAATVGLLAVIPTLGYAIVRPSLSGYLAALNVILIVGALYYAMAPIEGDHDGHGHEQPPSEADPTHH